MRPGPPCARCGKPAAGYATIDNRRYCHGDEQQPTCYMQESRERSDADNLKWIERYLETVEALEPSTNLQRAVDEVRRDALRIKSEHGPELFTLDDVRREFGIDPFDGH